MDEKWAIKWSLVQAALTEARKYEDPPMFNARTTEGRRFYATLKNAGITDKKERLEFLSAVLGREVKSTNELTLPESLAVTTHLDQELVTIVRSVDPEYFEGKEPEMTEEKKQEPATAQDQTSDMTFPEPEHKPIELFTLMGYTLEQAWSILTAPLPKRAYKAVGHMDFLTDINPAYTNQVLTAVFGPVGVGWYLKYNRDDVTLAPETRVVGKAGNKYEKTFYVASLLCGQFHYKLQDKQGATFDFSFSVTGGNDNKEPGYALKGMVTSAIQHAASRLRYQELVYKGYISHKTIAQTPAKKSGPIKDATVRIIKGLFGTLGYTTDQGVKDILATRSYPKLLEMTEAVGQSLVVKLSRQIALAGIDNGQGNGTQIKEAEAGETEEIVLVTDKHKAHILDLMVEFGYDTDKAVQEVLDRRSLPSLDEMSDTVAIETILKMDTAAQAKKALPYQIEQLVTLLVELGEIGADANDEERLAGLDTILAEKGHTGDLMIRQATNAISYFTGKLRETTEAQEPAF